MEISSLNNARIKYWTDIEDVMEKRRKRGELIFRRFCKVVMITQTSIHPSPPCEVNVRKRTNSHEMKWWERRIWIFSSYVNLVRLCLSLKSFETEHDMDDSMWNLFMLCFSFFCWCSALKQEHFHPIPIPISTTKAIRSLTSSEMFHNK